jgi:DNA-binding transcriptional MerR regulator
MSTPAGQLLPVKDLKRIQNLRSQQKSIKASKTEMDQYNEMKEEILQFMQVKKQKVKAKINHILQKNIKNISGHAANDEFFPTNYSQKNTFLVD